MDFDFSPGRINVIQSINKNHSTLNHSVTPCRCLLWQSLNTNLQSDSWLGCCLGIHILEQSVRTAGEITICFTNWLLWHCSFRISEPPRLVCPRRWLAYIALSPGVCQSHHPKQHGPSRRFPRFPGIQRHPISSQRGWWSTRKAIIIIIQRTFPKGIPKKLPQNWTIINCVNPGCVFCCCVH